MRLYSNNALTLLRLFALTLLGLMIACFASAETKVLYVTHEPGKHHKYTPQLKAFKDISKKAAWDLTVSTGEHESQIKWLRTKDFAVNHDVVVYNFCFAKSADLEAAYNLMQQTRENAVPAVLVHCSMHSWWKTFKSGVKDGKAHPVPDLVRKWKKEHPGKDFPVWGDFTGVASSTHGPRLPIKIEAVRKHPATERVSSGYTTGIEELYDNYYVLDKVIPLLRGKQFLKDGKTSEAIVMWECPQGKSKVLGLTLGHFAEAWRTEAFQNIITDSVNYLAE